MNSMKVFAGKDSMMEMPGSIQVNQRWQGFALLALLLAALSYALPDTLLSVESRHFLFLIGVIGAWRYSVGLLHFIRAQIFQRWYYPGLSRQAREGGADLMPSSVYLMVTSFRISVETSIEVYHSVFREAVQCRLKHGIEMTVVASIVEAQDEVLIRTLYESYRSKADISLVMVRIPGTGKRDGLASGFRAISRSSPAADAVVAVIDGDTVLEEGVTETCIPYFKLMPTVGALTTNEYCQMPSECEDKWGMMKTWHALRFGQRHLYMNSMGLSKRVLTLTGRMSIFRADIICNPVFIKDVEADYLVHWRLGKFRFLTGDDKSSWFSVMNLGYETFYVPDAMVKTIEHPPEKRFIKSTLRLMYRWYGNSLRQNARALKLGPGQMGWYAWYVLLDQRVSMWTCLIGPAFAILASIKYSITAGIAYILWVGITRTLMMLSISASGHPISALYPVLIYYNQVVGSLVKTYVIFRLDKQSWTRQDTCLSRNMDCRRAAFNDGSTKLTYASSLMVFLAFTFWLV